MNPKNSFLERVFKKYLTTIKQVGNVIRVKNEVQNVQSVENTVENRTAQEIIVEYRPQKRKCNAVGNRIGKG